MWARLVLGKFGLTVTFLLQVGADGRENFDKLIPKVSDHRTALLDVHKLHQLPGPLSFSSSCIEKPALTMLWQDLMDSVIPGGLVGPADISQSR